MAAPTTESVEIVSETKDIDTSAAVATTEAVVKDSNGETSEEGVAAKVLKQGSLTYPSSCKDAFLRSLAI